MFDLLKRKIEEWKNETKKEVIEKASKKTQVIWQRQVERREKKERWVKISLPENLYAALNTEWFVLVMICTNHLDNEYV